MRKPTIALSTLWLLFMASPLWLVLIAVVPNSTGWGNGVHRFVMAPVVLLGITVAIQRLLVGYKDAWALSALLAGIITFAALSLAAWMAS